MIVVLAVAASLAWGGSIGAVFRSRSPEATAARRAAAEAAPEPQNGETAKPDPPAQTEPDQGEAR